MASARCSTAELWCKVKTVSCGAVVRSTLSSGFEAHASFLSSHFQSSATTKHDVNQAVENTHTNPFFKGYMYMYLGGEGVVQYTFGNVP